MTSRLGGYFKDERSLGGGGSKKAGKLSYILNYSQPINYNSSCYIQTSKKYEYQDRLS